MNGLASQTSLEPRPGQRERCAAYPHRNYALGHAVKEHSPAVYVLSLTLTMSLFTSTLIEDKILLTVTIVGAALLAMLLLIAIKNATSAASSLAVVYCVLLVLLFLFLHDQVYTIAEPALEADELKDSIIEHT